ncbi:oligosaccharide flippase family protein [Microbacterium ureisolvens]|uniref:Oligosaccharide flippase family protein n=1 Tax=Microbacterium ureisolvens TaxID=2781186 RepID=A0ABS7I304_9MICO|nr:oligosaccharide flippase family protein [Microbacterium ureisolvens]MBW9111730.1 oligosaccharide flippase family protein [Microbacterium ureisolvens]
MNTSRSVAITSLANLVPPLVGLAVAPILASSLGAAGRGEVAAASAPLLLVIGVFTLGLPEAFTYYYAKHLALSNRTFLYAVCSVFGAGLASAVLISLFAGWLAAGDADLARLIATLGWLTPFALLVALLRGRAMGRGNWGLVFWERLIGSASRLALIAALAATGHLSVWSASITIGITSFAGGVAYLIPRRIAAAAVPAPVGYAELSSFGLRVWGGSVGGILLSRVDQLIMLPLAGAYELGIYAVAVSIVDVVLVFNAAVGNVVFSLESRESNDARLTRAARISTIGTLLIAGACAIVAIWLVPLLFGADFAQSVPVFAILALGVVLGNPGSVAGAGLNSRGHPGLRSVSLLAATAVNIAALFVLAPVLGAQGAALATLAGNCVAGFLNILWLRHFRVARARDFILIRRSDARAAWSACIKVARGER